MRVLPEVMPSLYRGSDEICSTGGGLLCGAWEGEIQVKLP